MAEFPATPVGRCAAAYFEAFNTGDNGAAKAGTLEATLADARRD
jgi:hypothetical protein